MFMVAQRPPPPCQVPPVRSPPAKAASGSAPLLGDGGQQQGLTMVLRPEDLLRQLATACFFSKLPFSPKNGRLSRLSGPGRNPIRGRLFWDRALMSTSPFFFLSPHIRPEFLRFPSLLSLCLVLYTSAPMDGRHPVHPSYLLRAATFFFTPRTISFSTQMVS